MRRLSFIAALAALAAVLALALQPSRPDERAVALRNRGLAELENEQPGRAEPIFRELVEALPDEPLGHADLAIALLRQQRFEEAERAIGRALELAPGRADLTAIQGEVYQWSGRPDQALAAFRRAAAAAPDDPEIQYALYRQATTGGGAVSGAEAERAAAEALERLARLRPENLIVIIQRGQRARAAGDRAAATAAFLRLRELSWQAPEAAGQLLAQILAALEAGDLEAARVPALRLENVLKVTSMYRESLRELASGIQGVPVARFAGEPPPASFGDPVPVSFRGVALSTAATAGRALAVGDFDGDRRPDLARVAAPVTTPVEAAAGAGPRLEVRRASADWAVGSTLDAAGIERLLAVDLDNDGRLDLLGYGPGRVRYWRPAAEGGFVEATSELGLEKAAAAAAAAIDFDVEGDLDLALAGGGSGGKTGAELYLNALAGPLEPVGAKSLPGLALSEVGDLLASDLDRDGDLDLVIAHGGGLAYLVNQRQGTFADGTTAAGLGAAAAARAAVSADLDNDGWPDLVTAGRGLAFYRNAGGRFTAWDPGGGFKTTASFSALAAFDADNDGRLDLAVGGPTGLAVLTQRPAGGWSFLNLDGAPAGATALAAADLDGDGDLDLVAAGPHGLHRLENLGGNRNRWLAVRLKGLEKGSGKNNVFGLGATLEVRAGSAYQFREATADVTHFGLGRLARADLLRVVWNNGVPQNRLAPALDQAVVEEQVLKGSCPFLYAWDGERVRFVTDLLWGAPAGLPVAPGVWAGADPDELVLVEGAAPRDGVYDLRVTEELWEAAFFDHVRLWVVDHPADVEVASSLRIVPGERVGERVLGTREARPAARVLDGRGEEVTAKVAERDGVFADGFRPSPYQGVAAEPWHFTLDLGVAPAAPVRLLLDGWIFPADASLNLAVAQRRDLATFPPRLEVETAEGWRTLMPSMGFPAGKTKTMVVDTPPLPEGARRLRIVATQWLSWDRVAWSLAPADDAPRVVARLPPVTAELRYRGFSALVREAPNAPHAFDYARISADSPWLPFPGRYTRYGDVRELLASPDDRSAILGAGDELALAFDASELGPPPAGWRRAVFLESHGWDKDADRNTWEAHRVEPLPFRAMSGYPWGPGEAFPDTPLHREYRERWLTRVIEPAPAGLSPASP